MARINVPDPYLPGIATLAALPLDLVTALKDALARNPVVLNPLSQASKLASSVNIPQAALTEILSTLIALSSFRISNDVPVAEFVRDLCTSLKSNKILASVDFERFTPLLEEFLGLDRIALAAKANAIQREHKSIFFRARAISDIRPIFLETEDKVAGTVIVHTLKISYIEENEPREFFVAMDDEDVASLQKILARAESKSKSLRALVTQAGIANFDGSADV